MKAYFIILVLPFSCLLLWSLQGILMNAPLLSFFSPSFFIFYLFRFDHELGLFQHINYLFYFINILCNFFLFFKYMSSLLLNFIWAEIIVPSLLSKLEMAKTAENQ